jgi:acyl-CoA dehydrogenase
VVPEFDDWYQAGAVPREMYVKLGELGVFGIEVPEEYGGAGIESYKYTAILTEESALAGVNFGGSHVHVELCLPYVKAYASDEQKKRWLPGFVSGETMFAIAMTEPGAGSDLAGMKTTARLSDDGSHYVLNGAKTFITGGVQADRVIVCARTAPPTVEDRRHGISLFVVDTRSKGYVVGRKLDKLGLKTSDAAELSFTDVEVPVEDLLGELNAGFVHLADNLPRERLTIAVASYAQARPLSNSPVNTPHNVTRSGPRWPHFRTPNSNSRPARLTWTPSRPSLIALSTRTTRARSPRPDAASVKLFCTETAARVIDRCLQLHGGYGYMNEYPIARLYADNRVHRIYGGTSEVMKVIIAKDLGL